MGKFRPATLIDQYASNIESVDLSFKPNDLEKEQSTTLQTNKDVDLKFTPTGLS